MPRGHAEPLLRRPEEYGRLLLTLGVSQPQASLTAAGAAWSFVNLKRRMIMLQDVLPRSTRSRIVAIAVVALAVAALVPSSTRGASGKSAGRAGCRTARRRRRAA